MLPGTSLRPYTPHPHHHQIPPTPPKPAATFANNTNRIENSLFRVCCSGWMSDIAERFWRIRIALTQSCCEFKLFCFFLSSPGYLKCVKYEGSRNSIDHLKCGSKKEIWQWFRLNECLFMFGPWSICLCILGEQDVYTNCITSSMALLCQAENTRRRIESGSSWAARLGPFVLTHRRIT